MKKDSKPASGRSAMVGGAKRPVEMYSHGGMTSGKGGVCKGMGKAVRGGKFRDM